MRRDVRILVVTSLRSRMRRFGTELVAHELARSWAEAGHDCRLAGHVDERDTTIAVREGRVAIAALPPLPKPSRWQHYDRHAEARGFRELVADFKPDVAIIVGFGPGSVTLTHLETLADAECPTTLWHHVPGISCQQHGLRYKNRTLCDGTALVTRCAACRLTAAGVPEFVAEIAARCPSPPSSWDLPGGLGHIAGANAMSAAFTAGVAALAQRLAHTFVGARWAKSVLLRNGFPPERLSMVRPGLRSSLGQLLALAPGDRDAAKSPLKLAYWGRVDTTKGIDTAIRAVRLLKGPVTLDIAGDFDRQRAYDRQLLCLKGDDERINFVRQLDETDLASFLLERTVAIIPSTWPETGPLAVFEARAAGLPILGARTGGIAEICEADDSARLFERGDHEQLARLITELIEDPNALRQRRASIPPVRTMDHAAADILRVFEARISLGSRGPGLASRG